jgi:hypothetical protein
MFTTVLMIGLIGQLPNGLKMPLQGKKQVTQQAAPKPDDVSVTVIPKDLGKAIQEPDALPRRPARVETTRDLTLIQMRQIIEAMTQAREWSRRTKMHYFRSLVELRYPPGPRRHAWIVAKEEFEVALLVAARKQVCDAYGISERQLAQVLRTPGVGKTRFVNEPNASQLIAGDRGPSIWLARAVFCAPPDLTQTRCGCQTNWRAGLHSRDTGIRLRDNQPSSPPTPSNGPNDGGP